MESVMSCFLQIDQNSDFPIQNIPFGVISTKKSLEEKRCASRIGDFAIDLSVLEKQGILAQQGPLMNNLKQSGQTLFDQPTLNNFMKLDKSYWSEVRKSLQNLLSENSPLKTSQDLQKQVFIAMSDVIMHMPAQIGDYTDFYSSKNHAFNIGTMLRGPQNALQDNWTHLPVGYHGRASSVVVSGHNLVRPRGQIKPAPDAKTPIFSHSKRVDFEMEMGVFIGGAPKPIGKPIKINDAEDSVFGFVLVNDWSARDIQAWEYVPLGPFNAKNLLTSISPWIITKEALEPFRIQLPEQQPEPLPYLKEKNHTSWDLDLEVNLISAKNPDQSNIVCKTNYKYMYWSINQQIAHHSVTGCNLNPGDLLASGTISGVDKGTFGSMMELSWNTKEPLTLQNGEQRCFLDDGDTVIMTGKAKNDKFKIGFGECSGVVMPCISEDNYY